MELDFIKDINEYNDSLIRLYNFDNKEAQKLRDLIEETVVKNHQKLDLSTVDFIELRNCNLILALYKTDEGIISNDEQTFYCALTLGSYYDMIDLLEPFCTKRTKGFQYLYEIDNPIDFLFSPAGTW